MIDLQWPSQSIIVWSSSSKIFFRGATNRTRVVQDLFLIVRSNMGDTKAFKINLISFM